MRSSSKWTTIDYVVLLLPAAALFTPDHFQLPEATVCFHDCVPHELFLHLNVCRVATMRHERAVNSSASAGFPTHVYTPSVNYMQVCLFVCFALLHQFSAVL